MTKRAVLVGAVWTITAVGATLMTTVAAMITEVVVTGPWLATFTALGAVVVVYASVGAILALRRPGNVVGLILLASGPLLVTTFCGFLLGAWFTEVNGPHDPMATLASLVGSLTVSPTLIVVAPVLALLFPDGRLPGRRWRWAVAAIGFVLILGTVMTLLRPGPLNVGQANNPFGISGQAWVDPVSAIGFALSLLMVAAALLLAVVATVVRFRRGGRVEREQIKWFVAANAVTVALLLVVMADPALDVTWFDAVAIASLSLPPLAVGVAIMRYRLFEIDRLIARTVSWGIVTGLLVGGFAAAVVALQAVLADFIQGQTIAVAASTLVAFALFQPLRRRVQSAVDRRFDRAHYDAQRTLAEFSDRLRDEVDLAALSGDLDATIRDAISPRSFGIWLRESKR